MTLLTSDILRAENRSGVEGRDAVIAVLATRAEVPIEETWDLTAIYPTLQDWTEAAEAIRRDMVTLGHYRGRLAEGAGVLLACLQSRDSLSERLLRVVAYAWLHGAADGRAPDNQALGAQARALEADARAAMAFVTTDVLTLPEGTIARYLGEDPALETYRPVLENALRRRAHLLEAAAEEALATLAEVLDAPFLIYQRATAGDLVCPPVFDAAGQEVPVSIARYTFGLGQSPDRDLRRRAYASLAAGVGAHKATLATTLAAFIKRNVALARLRRYPSAIAMLLDGQGVSEAIYRTVLATVHDEIAPHMRRLLELQRRVLGLEQLARYDLEAPLDPGYEPPVSFEHGAHLIREGLSVLGDRYGVMLATAFRDRWIDRADNLGKSAGALCYPVYGVHPYIFTTWQDTLYGAMVLAHELGHAGHQYLAAARHPVSSTATMADFAGLTFFLEAPSTANELLLGRHLLATADDPRLRRRIIAHLLGTFTNSMVRQLLAAHVEDRLYTRAEAGQPLTLATLMEVQGDVFERFFAGTVVIDDAARLFWAQQPHFYLGGLLSYTYSAGLTCAYSITEAIRIEGQPAVERWLATLEAGMTLPAAELMRRAGVDLSSPAPIRRAVGYFGALVDELERGFA